MVGARRTIPAHRRGRGGFLARRFDCPPERSADLAQVSQYVALTKGVGPLYDELHAVFDHDYPPGAVHSFAAELPAIVRDTRRDVPAARHDALRPDARACVRRGRRRGRRRLVRRSRSGPRQVPAPAARRRGDGDRRAERLRGAHACRAPDDPEAPRAGRPAPGARPRRASSSARTTTSATWPRRRSRTSSR